MARPVVHAPQSWPAHLVNPPPPLPVLAKPLFDSPLWLGLPQVFLRLYEQPDCGCWVVFTSKCWDFFHLLLLYCYHAICCSSLVLRQICFSQDPAMVYGNRAKPSGLPKKKVGFISGMNMNFMLIDLWLEMGKLDPQQPFLGLLSTFLVSGKHCWAKPSSFKEDNIYLCIFRLQYILTRSCWLQIHPSWVDLRCLVSRGAEVARLPHLMLFKSHYRSLKSLPRFAHILLKLLNISGSSGSASSRVSNSWARSLRSYLCISECDDCSAQFELPERPRAHPAGWDIWNSSTIAAWMAFNFWTFCTECWKTSCSNASQLHSRCNWLCQYFLSLAFQWISQKWIPCFIIIPTFELSESTMENPSL